jgi:hypothetical protein
MISRVPSFWRFRQMFGVKKQELQIDRRLVIWQMRRPRSASGNSSLGPTNRLDAATGIGRDPVSRRWFGSRRGVQEFATGAYVNAHDARNHPVRPDDGARSFSRSYRVRQCQRNFGDLQ